ncbi:MAG: N-acetylneuraminate synthase [Methylocystaceae bacterium]
MAVYIIAEAGVNHNGSLGRAVDMIDCAKKMGADAVKFQMFRAGELASHKAEKAEYQVKNTGSHGNQLHMLEQLELRPEDFRQLKAYSQEQMIEFLVSPFDICSLDYLVQELGLSTIKVGSGEITNAPLLLQVARYKKQVILSTGMSTLGEIENALAVLALGYSDGNCCPSMENLQQSISSSAWSMLQDKVTLLHCTTEYPAPFQEANLKVIQTLKNTLGLRTGFSDHTRGITAAIAAVALGAEVVEKHFTLDKSLPGPDHAASLEPFEFKQMVQGIRETEMALGDGIKRPSRSEFGNREIARKSLVARLPIRTGELFTADNLGIKRPGGGISPFYYWYWLDKKADRDYEEDEMIIPWEVK